MVKVIVTLGCSASGKSTWAKQFVAENAGWVIVERDKLREMMGFPPVGSNDQEKIITKMQRGLIETSLLDGMNVIVADTNINNGLRKSLVDYVHKLGHDVEFRRFDTDLDTCIARDLLRDKPVGEVIIRKQFARMQGVGDLQPAPVQTYETYQHHDLIVDEVICVDIDGTVAKCINRSPYDYSKVIDDSPIEDVINVVKALSAFYEVIFVSGRSDDCRAQTEKWLNTHVGISSYDLFMRKSGDSRPDYIIKNEIYDEHIIPFYNIKMVFDDRNSVVQHLRKRNITVSQVNYGRF